MAIDCGRVLIADPDGGVRAAISALFRRAGVRTSEARSGNEALASVRRRRPALVMLDVHLPGVSGYAVCDELRTRYGNELPIILLSATRTEPSDRVAGFLVGADDYVAKPFDPDELFARARRLIVRAHSVTVRTNDGASTTREVIDRTNNGGLTKREQEILELLALGLRQREIAERLVISPTTVATHIQRILGKLGVHSRAEAVARAHLDAAVAENVAQSVWTGGSVVAKS